MLTVAQAAEAAVLERVEAPLAQDALSTPHVEPLMARTDAAALEEASALLATHASGIAAHVLCGETRIGTVRPPTTRPDSDPDETIPA